MRGTVQFFGMTLVQILPKLESNTLAYSLPLKWNGIFNSCVCMCVFMRHYNAHLWKGHIHPLCLSSLAALAPFIIHPGFLPLLCIYFYFLT